MKLLRIGSAGHERPAAFDNIGLKHRDHAQETGALILQRPMACIKALYTVNDTSEREFQLERSSQWGLSTSCRTFKPRNVAAP